LQWGADLAASGLFGVFEHGRVIAQVFHVDAQVGVTHRELNAFFAQLAVHFLKAGKRVLQHYECVGPRLHQSKELSLGMLPLQRDLFVLEFHLQICLAPDSQQPLQHHVSIKIGSQALVEPFIRVLAHEFQQVYYL